jgi:mannose/fructose/N-acetylgalactosamine-specific phosphotransferase system component IIC
MTARRPYRPIGEPWLLMGRLLEALHAGPRTTAELAELLQVVPTTVTTTIHRARAILPALGYTIEEEVMPGTGSPLLYTLIKN